MKKALTALTVLLGLAVVSHAAIINWGSAKVTFSSVAQGGATAQLVFLDPNDLSRTILDTRTTATAPTVAIGNLSTTASALQTITYGGIIPGTGEPGIAATTGLNGFFVRIFNTAGTHYIDSSLFTFTGTPTALMNVAPAQNFGTILTVANPAMTHSSGGWTPVPEPATGMLALAGIAMLLRRRRR